MSLCVSCPGGFTNMRNEFHPVVRQVLRAEAESCLDPYRGLLVQELGFALEGSRGAPSLAASLPSNTTGELRLDVGGVATGARGLLFVSTKAIGVPYLGGTLVPSRQYVLRLTADSRGRARSTLPLPIGAQQPLYAQAWFQDTQGATASPALELRVVLE